VSELPSSEDLDPSTGADAPTPPTTTGPSSYTLNWEEPVIPRTLEAQRERIASRNSKPEFCDFTVYDRADQTPIGVSSLFHIDHRNGTAQFGIDLGERRGQGLGTEATRLTLDWGFTVLGLHNIMLAVAAWNDRAIRVYTKVGFREIGRRRGAGLTMCRRHDGVYMDLLATEFLQANGSVLARRGPHAGNADD
jgi:RimJ/RimL family protein N-acetyltransferase